MKNERTEDAFLRGKIPQSFLRKMKLTVLLSFLVILQLGATQRSLAQKRVSLDLRNVTLEEFFMELREQTGNVYVFNMADIAAAGDVTVRSDNELETDVLDRVLGGLNLGYKIVEDYIVVFKLQAKDEKPKKSVTVKGFVYDEKKQPLPGVTVQVVGTSVGTATTEKGWFSIDLPMLKGKLKFSFVGYKSQEVEFTEKTDTLKIYMKEEASDLDEVVVRAYGTQKKREVISAISTVTADEMKELPSASITSMLQGRLAGLNIIQQSGAPGSAPVIAVRGFNSLLVDGASDGQPLWVIDGVPMHSFVSPVTGTNTLADLDPSMIESVQVLKDAAAASIYGSRAGNGVILITTKKGKVGEAKFAANVSYTLSQLMEYPVQTGGRMERWYDILYQRNRKQTYSSYDENWNRFEYYPTSYESVWGTSGSYDAFWKNGVASSAMLDLTLQDSLDPYYNNSTNWWKYAFRTGRVVNANVQASGGSEKFRYMVGIGYYDEKGIMINSAYKRANLISNLTAQFTKKLRMDTRVSLSYVDRSVNKSGVSSSRGYEGLSVNPIQQRTIFGATDAMMEEWLEKVEGQKDRTDDYRAMVSAFLEYEVIDGLSLSASANVDFSQGNMNLFSPSTLDDKYHENKSQGAINRMVMLSTEELLHYNKSIKEKHNIDLLLGFNANKEQNYLIEGYGTNGASDDVYYYDPDRTEDIVNHGSEKYPNYVPTRWYKSDFTEKKMMSFFGRLSYNFKQRYLMEFTFRRDGSSTFGEGNKWANFPSFALGWAFSEESFIKSWTGKWLNWGKIRASYGTSGQIFTEAYLAHGLMRVESTTFLGHSSVTSEKPISPDLTWEKTEQYDVGLDMDMFDYRLNIKLDYYYKYTSSLIYGVPLSGSTYPFYRRTENAMEVSNEGIELELQADILREGPVSWRSKFNISRNWNLFEKSYSGEDIDGIVIGRPLNCMYVYEDGGFYESEDEVPHYYSTDGDDTFWGGVTVRNGVSGEVGNYKLGDFNGDNNADMYLTGSTLPLVHGGWVNELMWKNFDLNMLVNYVIGRKMINACYTSFTTPFPETKMADYRKLKFWSQPGDDANMPALGYEAIYKLDSNIEEVNYLSLKQLTLGYNLPKNIASRIGFSGVRFFATVENLFYLSNYSGGNPEVVDVYSGIDEGKAYPLPRKWTLGLTLNF